MFLPSDRARRYRGTVVPTVISPSTAGTAVPLFLNRGDTAHLERLRPFADHRQGVCPMGSGNALSWDGGPHRDFPKPRISVKAAAVTESSACHSSAVGMPYLFANTFKALRAGFTSPASASAKPSRIAATASSRSAFAARPSSRCYAAAYCTTTSALPLTVSTNGSPLECNCRR